MGGKIEIIFVEEDIFFFHLENKILVGNDSRQSQRYYYYTNIYKIYINYMITFLSFTAAAQSCMFSPKNNAKFIIRQE